MAKKKKKKSDAVEVAPDRSPETVTLYGDNVIKDVTVDQEVKLYATEKITQISREHYDDNRLQQRIEISSVKQVATSADL